MYPRIRNLPKEEQKPFKEWLYGQTCPYEPSIPREDNDFYYPWDYKTWKDGMPCTD